MQQQTELCQVGIYEAITPSTHQTIREMMAEQGIDIASIPVLGILVNGKKAQLDDFVNKTDEVVIIPNIAGGCSLDN